jgi:hypothetical protein
VMNSVVSRGTTGVISSNESARTISIELHSSEFDQSSNYSHILAESGF